MMFLNGGMSRFTAKARNRVDALFSGALSPRELSFTLCLGIVLGVMPLIWGTTLVCVALATRFRLNQPAMLAINYLCYPLQLALFIPFCRLGEFLLPWGPAAGSTVLDGALHGDLSGSMHLVAWATARALGGWLLTALPLALLAYLVLRRVLYSRGRRTVGVATN